MGRVLVMLPIFLSMGERLGFGPGSTGRTGITLAVAAGSIFLEFRDTHRGGADRGAPGCGGGAFTASRSPTASIS